jgi:hypothetical protein
LGRSPGEHALVVKAFPEFRRFLEMPDRGSAASVEPIGIGGSIAPDVTEGAIEPPPTPLLSDPHPPR